MRKKQNFKKLAYLLLTLFLLILAVLGGRVISPAFATTSGYSGVLEDLRKDGSFNFLDYPEKSDDYSIQVIQIAESTDGELFIYTYQPCQSTTPLIATEVNMSLTEKMGFVVDDSVELIEKDKPKTYKLTFLNSWGVFCKYKVADFSVSSDTVRYYNIASIFRDWIKGIDKETGNDNTVNYKSFEVGNCFKVETIDGELNYSCVTTDTVEILNPFVNFLSYYNGMTWGAAFGLEGDSFTDVHYIAFSTDRQIDTLKEADVTYTTQPYKQEAFSSEITYGAMSDPQYITLTGEMGGSTPDGFLTCSYSWKCIQRSEEFVEKTPLNSSTAATVKKSDYVLVFHTTPYTKKQVTNIFVGHSFEISGTKVSNVSILRLKFVTNGKTYNLGAVSDKVTGDDIAGNAPAKIGFFAYIWRCIVRLFKGTASIIEGLVAVVAILVVLVLLPVLLIVLSLVFPAFRAVLLWIVKGVGYVCKYLCIGLWYVISAPVRLVIGIVHKIRGE